MKFYDGFSSIIRKSQIRHVCAIALAMLLIIGISLGCAPTSQVPQVDNTINAGATTEAPALYDENAVVSLYEQAIPAVVEVNTAAEFREKPFPFEPFPQIPQKHQGSGFIIDEQGHILTNYHVIEGVSSVKVTLYDDRTLDAEVVGADPQDDLALLKVDADEVSDITPLPLGDSDAVKPGQMAIALGSPFGLEGSITVGVISGVGRPLRGVVAGRVITNMLQTDAAINPGNSGGPLLNSKGEVIGINTAMESPSYGATGIGFAIPINTAKSVLPSLLQGEEVRRPWLGVKGQAITPELAKRLDLVVNQGVYVVEVVPNSPAEKAGLRESGTDRYGDPTFGGDVITAVDGRAVARVEDLIDYFNTKKPGDEVFLSVYRGNQSITVEVTLGEWPEEIS